MDTKPRKILKHALHLEEDVDECELPRYIWGLAIMSLEEMGWIEGCGLSEYLKGSTYNKGGVMDMFLRESNPKELREE